MYCDHGHEAEEVRVLPLSSGEPHGNIILCQRHHNKELSFRRENGWESTPAFNAYPRWGSLKIYSAE